MTTNPSKRRLWPSLCSEEEPVGDINAWIDLPRGRGRRQQLRNSDDPDDHGLSVVGHALRRNRGHGGEEGAGSEGRGRAINLWVLIILCGWSPPPTPKIC